MGNLSSGLCEESAAKMTRTSTWEPRLEPESSASTNSAMAAYEVISYKTHVFLY